MNLHSNNVSCAQCVGAARLVPRFLLFVQVMMPQLDGLEATRRISTDPRYSKVPIIGVTGHCGREALQRCLEAGMTAAMGKPVDTPAMLALLRQHPGHPPAPSPHAAIIPSSSECTI